MGAARLLARLLLKVLVLELLVVLLWARPVVVKVPEGAGLYDGRKDDRQAAGGESANERYEEIELRDESGENDCARFGWLDRCCILLIVEAGGWWSSDSFAAAQELSLCGSQV